MQEDGENCIDSGYHLEEESTGFADSLPLRYERKKEVNNEPVFSVLYSVLYSHIYLLYFHKRFKG